MGSRYFSKRTEFKNMKMAKQRRPRHRPKSFKTEAAAKKWVEANKITKYTLRNLKSSESKSKKIVVVLSK
ncbi:hypothetical protein J4209_05485 [Candidatus Woesearchaeota archaeon]|nr:hypothetical protein [Candidatus Woesearchaeota archaeon]